MSEYMSEFMFWHAMMGITRSKLIFEDVTYRCFCAHFFHAIWAKRLASKNGDETRRSKATWESNLTIHQFGGYFNPMHFTAIASNFLQHLRMSHIKGVSGGSSLKPANVQPAKSWSARDIDGYSSRDTCFNVEICMFLATSAGKVPKSTPKFPNLCSHNFFFSSLGSHVILGDKNDRWFGDRVPSPSKKPAAKVRSEGAEVAPWLCCLRWFWSNGFRDRKHDENSDPQNGGE